MSSCVSYLSVPLFYLFFFFFFNDTATTEIYTLSLHDALPISASVAASGRSRGCGPASVWRRTCMLETSSRSRRAASRSEEHTSELQSRLHLVCRLLLEKKKKKKKDSTHTSSRAKQTAVSGVMC